MKLRRNKKGFTIIELVIVIAVIGILAAVLIPTFVNLTNKANEAADNALVNNLNKALKMEEQEPGHEKSPTLEGAIKDLEHQGYILENLATKSEKKLFWSQSKNEFLLDQNPAANKDYWLIVDAIPAQDDQKYSYYAGKDFAATTVTVKYGFDAGKNEGIATVNYVGTGSAQEVAIRTNGAGAKLNVKAPTDNVHHYNYLYELKIDAVADGSYYEHGTIQGKATISKGHLEIEAGAKVSQVLVSAATGNVKVTANEQTTIVVDQASAAQATVVANADKVNVAGVAADKISGEKASSAVTATKVMDEDELALALDGEKPFIQLGKAIEVTEILAFNNVKLDLNGFNLSFGSNTYALDVYGETELLDSAGTGKITAEKDYGAWLNPNSHFVMNGGTFDGCYLNVAENSKATINGGKFINCNVAIYNIEAILEINNVKIENSSDGVCILGNGDNGSATLIMNGGEMSVTECGIIGNGTATYSGTHIEINGGKITSGDTGIYHPQNGVLKIKGNPVITAKTALYIKSGVTTITGGKFVATLAPKEAYQYYGNGCIPTGDAIVIDACNYPGGNPSFECTIDNASFELADHTAKNVAYYSYEDGHGVVVVNGQQLNPEIVDSQN